MDSSGARSIVTLVAVGALGRFAHFGVGAVSPSTLYDAVGASRTLALLSLGGWLHVVGGFIAAGMAYAAAPRLAVLAGAVGFALAIGGSLAGFPVPSTIFGSIADGGFSVGLLAHAAAVFAGDGSPPTPRRFAAMSAFVLGCQAFGSATALGLGLAELALGTAKIHVLCIIAMLTAAALFSVISRGKRVEPARPIQAPYRAPSPIAIEPARATGNAVRALRPLVLPALLFAAIGGFLRQGTIGSIPHFVTMVAAAGGAAFFLNAAQARSPVPPLRVFGLGLAVLGAGAVGTLAAETFVVLAVVRSLVAAAALVAGGIGTAYAALAIRGRAAALPVACWTAGSLAASSVAVVFNYSVHPSAATFLGILAVVVGGRFTRAVATHHARFA